MSTTNDETWIREFLIPHLLENGKLMQSSKKKNDNDVTAFVIKDVSIRPLTSKEAFMLTSCYKVQVTIEWDNGENFVRSLVVKKTPAVTEESYKATCFDTLFSNEIMSYTEIIPALGQADRYPEYFYSHRKNLDAAIVLGDFSVDGWNMTRRATNLSLEHILLSVRELGRFHGSFYALKQNTPEKFHKIAQAFGESRYGTDPPPPFTTLMTISHKRAIKAVKDSEISLKIPGEFLEKLFNLLSDPYTYYRTKVKPSEPLAIICHGDYLRNNLAFKYTDEGMEHPSDIMMFDFQTLRYSSPMGDLTTFMANSTGFDVRSKNFDSIFRCYWNELTNYYLSKVSGTTKQLPEYFSYESMLNEYIRYLPYGFSIASWFIPCLHDPFDMTAEELLLDNRSLQEIEEDTMTRGGEAVNLELRSLIYEIYKFSTEYNVDIFTN